VSNSSGQKQGQAAAGKRARDALANQDERRSRRPLESSPSKAAPGTLKADQQALTDPRSHDAPKKGTPNNAALLKQYGVVTVPKTVYEWGGYRYSNPEDAIAAAKRGARA
jgi:hypothetical protein